MNICGYLRESVNEGEGLRAVVFISGCLHRCRGCFSPDTWSFSAGSPFTEAHQDEIIAEIAANPLLDGLTLCGGDPFYSAADCAAFVRKFRAACPSKTVWAYTGFAFEALMDNAAMRELAILCDIIVDGRYDENQRDVSLKYRGSRNQRIISVRNGESERHK